MSDAERGARAMLMLAAALACAGCLENGKVDVAPERDCTCEGTRCIGGVVSMLTDEASDDEGDSCLACHLQEIGRCVDGCGGDPFEVPGCQAAFACHSWDRHAVGDTCSDVHQCEPGPAESATANSLGCGESHCVDLGTAKWPSTVMPARECAGEPFFGPHPSCGGAACLAPEPYGAHRYCSAGRCLADADCPQSWHCRCLEEHLRDGLRAQRWCVPDI